MNRVAEKLGGLHADVPGSATATIVVGPLLCPWRVTRLVVADGCAPWFDILGAEVNGQEAAPFVVWGGRAPAVSFLASRSGAAFPLPKAQPGESIAVRIENTGNSLYRFEGALIGLSVDPDETGT